MTVNPSKNPALPRLFQWSEATLHLIFFGSLFALFCLLYAKGPMIQPDSGGYIHNATIRSPLYPIVISAYTKILGTENFQLLVFLQLFAGFAASFYTAFYLTRFFKLPKIVFYLVSCLLLFPYYGPGLFGNTILTEALCYPLFLLFFCFLFEGIQNKNSKRLMGSMCIAALLVLTRGQFLFLYPAIGIVIAYIFIFEARFFKTFKLILCFILMIAGTNLAERTYQYFYHGQFKLVPFTGIQLIIAPLYLSRATDSEYLKNDVERSLFQDIWAAMEEKKINFASLKSDSYFHMATYTHFYDNYNRICWESLAPLLSKYDLKTPYAIDATLTHMGFTLILHNLKGFFILYLLNIILNIGGIYFALLIGIAALYSVIVFFKNRHPLALLYLLASLLTAGNYLLVALVEPVLRRYSAYTDALQISAFLIIIAIAFQHTLTAQAALSKTPCAE